MKVRPLLSRPRSRCWQRFFLVLVLAVVAGSRGSIIGQLPMAIPPDALADRANQILRKLGSGRDIADRATGFQYDRDYLRMGSNANGPPAWWTDLRIGRPSALIFWYRTSPDVLAPSSPAGRVNARDPPLTLPGMQQIWLDTEGRLVEFQSVPPATVLENSAADAPWPALFEAANLDLRTFTPATPTWLPSVFADATAAWEGPIPGRADMRVRIEAASYRNHPVSFRIVWPWTAPPRPDASQRTGLQRLTDGANIAMRVAILIGGILLARRNLRGNRSDRRGAARLAIAMTMRVCRGQPPDGDSRRHADRRESANFRRAGVWRVHRRNGVDLLPCDRAVRAAVLA